MKLTPLACAAALLALGGCGSNKPSEQPSASATAEPPKPKPLSEVDPEAYHDNLESAMREIPPALRPDFQKLLACEVARQKSTGEVQPLNAKLVRELTSRLKSDPNAATSCAA